MRTRDDLLLKLTTVLNQRGYAGSSMTRLMRSTGLKKGGLYHHFKNKQSLAEDAFQYGCTRVGERYDRFLESAMSPTDSLIAIIDAFVDLAEHPPFPGGCPVLNAVIDSDDAHPAIARQARVALDRWQARIIAVLMKGIQRHEFNRRVPVKQTARRVIALLEGGMMLSRAYRDVRYVREMADHLKTDLVPALRARPHRRTL